MKQVGTFIPRLAREEGKSLRTLAEESGVSNPCLSQVTRGLFTPAPEILIELAPCLEVTPRRLFEEAGWLKPKSTKSAKAKKRQR